MPVGETGLAGPAVQLVHSRWTKTSTNNHGNAGLQHQHKLFISKLHLAERAVFLVGRTPLKAEINSADGLPSPLWKRHYVLDGDAQLTRGVWDDAKRVSVFFSFVSRAPWCWMVLPGSPAKHSIFQAVFTGCHTAVHKKRFQSILHLILSSVIWASIRSNSREANGVPLI